MPLNLTHHTCPVLSREAVTLPLGGSVYGRVDAPGQRVLPLLTLQATQGRNTLGLGLLLLPGVQRRTGPGPVAAARAQRGGNQSSHVGPAFISQLQRGANKLCPRARRQQLPARGPRLLSPSSSCFFPESQQSLSPRGTPEGPPLLLELERGGSARLREGRGWDPHTWTCSHLGPNWELEANTPVSSDLY